MSCSFHTEPCSPGICGQQERLFPITGKYILYTPIIGRSDEISFIAHDPVWQGRLSFTPNTWACFSIATKPAKVNSFFSNHIWLLESKKFVPSLLTDIGNPPKPYVKLFNVWVLMIKNHKRQHCPTCYKNPKITLLSSRRQALPAMTDVVKIRFSQRNPLVFS